jgi:hypothetical protein
VAIAAAAKSASTIPKRNAPRRRLRGEARLGERESIRALWPAVALPETKAAYDEAPRPHRIAGSSRFVVKWASSSVAQ